mgnify:FL=1
MSISAQLIKAARMHAEGELERAKTNIMVYMQNAAGIGEHSDIVEAIQKELTTMGHAHERLEILEKYFTGVVKTEELLQEDSQLNLNI